MKALIPSHKEEKRYILLKKTTKAKVANAIKNYIGILGLSEASPRWINENILCINRKSLEKVRAALALSKEDIEIKKVSGTLKKLKN